MTLRDRIRSWLGTVSWIRLQISKENSKIRKFNTSVKDGNRSWFYTSSLESLWYYHITAPQAVQLLSSSAAGIIMANAGCSLPTMSPTPRWIMYEYLWTENQKISQKECREAVLWIRSDPKFLAGSGSGYRSGKKLLPDLDPGSYGSEMNLK